MLQEEKIVEVRGGKGRHLPPCYALHKHSSLFNWKNKIKKNYV